MYVLTSSKFREELRSLLSCVINLKSVSSSSKATKTTNVSSGSAFSKKSTEASSSRQSGSHPTKNGQESNVEQDKQSDSANEIVCDCDIEVGLEKEIQKVQIK